MMKLSTLWAFDRTVAPDGSSPIATSIAQRWRHDPGSVKFFRSSANVIYTLEIDGVRSFLRCAATTERSRDVIEDELAIIEQVRTNGVPVVRALSSRSGQLIETVETALGQFHAVLFAGIPGTQKNPASITVREMFAWGAAVGRLHTALATVPPGQNRKPPAWQAVITAAMQGNEAVRQEAMRLDAVLRSLSTGSATYGLLHNDPELDNLIWRDGEATILDFDEYSTGWYLHDIAKALDEVINGGHIEGNPRVDAFLAGYRSQRPLDDEMLELLPEFSALTRLHGWYLLDRAIDLTVDDVDQAWMQSLIARLMQHQQDYVSTLMSNPAT
jgi:Ser/Thr protein kinase RdoA (MazF antagonist)